VKKEAGYWIHLAQSTIANCPLLLVGIGVDQLRSFQTLGGIIRGAVSVLPCGAAISPVIEPFPLLTLEAETRDIFQLVVKDYSETLFRNLSKVLDFFSSVDSSRECTIVSYLPIPSTVLEGRKAWAQDSVGASQIEDKSKTAELLSGNLMAVPSEIVTWPFTRKRWDTSCRKFKSSRLILQQLGLNGGGTGTRFCDEYPVASRAFTYRNQEKVKLMPWIDGIPCNIMATVLDHDRTLVFPPSRQINNEEQRKPIYSGNDFGLFLPNDELQELTREVREFGRVLANRGFVGPFGLDFIRKPNGTRLYHDINPRMNGAFDSLAFYLSRDGIDPLRVLLLSRRNWHLDDIEALEETLLFHVKNKPLVRFFLSRVMEQDVQIKSPPSTGMWKIDLREAKRPGLHQNFVLDGLRLQYKPRFSPSPMPSHYHVWFRSLMLPGTVVRKNDRLILGDLYCSTSTVQELQDRSQQPLYNVLLNALFN